MKILENKIIVSTRPISDDDNIKQLLLEKGATVIDFPMIKTVSKIINNEIIEFVLNINTFKWLVFTSKNAVKAFYETYENYIDYDKIKLCKIAVVGHATAIKLQQYGFAADFISKGKNAEKLASELIQNQLNENEKVLLVLGDLADNTLAENLAEFVETTRIDVYETIEPNVISAEIIELIKQKKYDLLLFTSPSTIRNFMKVIRQNQCTIDFTTACIGKTTEKEMISLGVIPNVIASEPSAEKFVAEIENYLLNKI